jgi:tRNA (guanosine-2'-O-)-methyltransferase
MSNLRLRANKAKESRCTTLIAVLENPKTLENIGSVIRNVDGLGVQKLYVIDGNNLLPSDWETMRGRSSLNKISASAIKWTYVRRFPNTLSCIDHLQRKKYVSVVTSPHVKGRKNFSLDVAKFTQKRLAVWFGNESRGISELAVDKSEFCVSIPMCGIIESLNLGTCSGIVLYEVTKQRRTFRNKPSKVNASTQ